MEEKKKPLVGTQGPGAIPTIDTKPTATHIKAEDYLPLLKDNPAYNKTDYAAKADPSTLAPNVDAIKSTIPDKVGTEPGKPHKQAVDPSQDDVWGQLAKHYEAMANKYTPESAEDAAKRERREKLASVMAGINDVGRAFANMITTSKGGIHAFDATKDSATPRVQAMIDKAAAQRQGKEGLYNQYMALRAEALGQGEKQKQQAKEQAQKEAYQQMQLKIQLAEQARKEREAALNEQLKARQIDEAGWKAAKAKSDAEYAGALAQADLEYKKAQRSKAMAEAYKAGKSDKYELNVWDETNHRIKTLTFDTKEDRNKAAWNYTIAMGLDDTYTLNDGQYGMDKEHQMGADQLAGQVENESFKRKREWEKENSLIEITGFGGSDTSSQNSAKNGKKPLPQGQK